MLLKQLENIEKTTKLQDQLKDLLNVPKHPKNKSNKEMKKTEVRPHHKSPGKVDLKLVVPDHQKLVQ